MDPNGFTDDFISSLITTDISWLYSFKSSIDQPYTELFTVNVTSIWLFLLQNSDI